MAYTRRRREPRHCFDCHFDHRHPEPAAPGHRLRGLAPLMVIGGGTILLIALVILILILVL
jgi:hypothetical protein